MAGKTDGKVVIVQVVPNATDTEEIRSSHHREEENDQRKLKNVRFFTTPTKELNSSHDSSVNDISRQDDHQKHQSGRPNVQPGMDKRKTSVVSAVLKEFDDREGSHHRHTNNGSRLLCPPINGNNQGVQTERQRRASQISTSDVDDVFSTEPLGSARNSRRSVVSEKPFLSRFNQSLQEFKRIEIAKSQVRRSLSRVSTLLCVLAIIAGCLMVVDLEYYNMRLLEFRVLYPNTTAADLTRSKWSEMPPSLIIVFVLKMAISIDSLLTVAALYCYYYKQCRLLIIKHHLPETATVLTSPLRGYYLVELFVCAFHVPPLLDVFVPGEMQLLIFLRFYLIARYMREHNEMAKSKSTRFLASVMQTELQSSFLIKSYFLKHPFVMIFIFYCLNIFGVGYAVYAFDRAASRDKNYNSFQDSVWMLVVTMTTLGFGDVSPDSLLGRTLVGISSIFGIFLMALLISVIHEGLTLTQQEKRILAYVERQEFVQLRKDYAARCIQATWKLYRQGKKTQHVNIIKTRRMSTLPHLVKTQPDTERQLKYQLYNALYNWRAVRKGREDHWVREFVSDNTAILLTDVARKIEQIEELLVQKASREERSQEDINEEIHTVPQTVWHRESTSSEHASYPPKIVHVKPASSQPGDAFDEDHSVTPAVVLRQIDVLDTKLEEMYNACKSELHALHSIVTAMSGHSKI